MNLNYVERDYKRQEDGMGSKLKELDKLYKENETLREELQHIQKNYDFEEIEMKLALYREKDEAILDLFESLTEFWNVVDSDLLCTMCQDTMHEVQILGQCGHSFCS